MMRRRVTRLIRSAGLLFVLGAVSGCDESPTGPSLNDEFTLAPGETTAMADAGVRIRFDRVEGDSRCPADAVCVQGGDAVVRIAVVERSTESPYELHTGSMEPVTHDGLTIALVQLQPYPFSSRSIEPGDYRATLRVTR
jgi:hypothetical protein